MDIISVNDYVTQIYPNSKFKPSLLINSYVLGFYLVLNINGAADCVYHTPELNEHPIAHRLDNATAMLIDRGVDQDTPKLFQPSERAFLIQADKTAIANH